MTSIICINNIDSWYL